jgi:hypothetical protein
MEDLQYEANTFIIVFVGKCSPTARIVNFVENADRMHL